MKIKIKIKKYITALLTCATFTVYGGAITSVPSNPGLNTPNLSLPYGGWSDSAMPAANPVIASIAGTAVGSPTTYALAPSPTTSSTSSTTTISGGSGYGFANPSSIPNANNVVQTSPTATNVTTAATFTAPVSVIQNIDFLFSLLNGPKDERSQIKPETWAFIKQIISSLKAFIKLIQQPEFTTYLQERDIARRGAYVTPQTLTSAFTASIANHTIIYYNATNLWNQISTGINSLFNYDMLLQTLGEGSEIKLRDRLIPIANIIVKLFQ